MKITVLNESITRIDCDAIVNPANSFGYMGGGVAKVLRDVGGQEIEDEAITEAPIEIGNAKSTTSGDLRCEAIIHTPTMRDVGQTDAKRVEDALQAALELAEEEEYKKIAIPGMGTGIGGLDPREAAKVMINMINDFEYEHLEEIILIDTDEEMTDAWEELI